MALDTALSAAHALASDTPQQPLALVAVSGRGGRPHLEVVRRGAGNGVNESLQGLLVDVDLLQGVGGSRGWQVSSAGRQGRMRSTRERAPTSSSLCSVLDVRADVMPAFLEF